MRYYLLALLLINLIGFYNYVNYSINAVSFRKQMITAFFCPIGSVIGRILFSFKIKENCGGLVMGILFYLFISVIAFMI